MVYLYIDPGTGSMIISILLGLFSVLFFLIHKIRIRLKTLVLGGRVSKKDIKHIPYVIYTDSGRYWNVFKPICDLFEKNEIPVTYWTSSQDDPALVEEYRYVISEYIGDINKAATRLNVLDADICISTTPGLNVYQWKCSPEVKCYVHICHSAWDINCYRMFGLDFYDTVLLNGEYQIAQLRELEELRELYPKELKVVGLTYLDELKKRYEACEKNKEGSDMPTVLLAPSWGKGSILCRYGADIIESLIATGYNIVIRPHPQSLTSDAEVVLPLMKKYPDSDKLKWNRDNDNFEVLKSADIMISDFSGVIFDYTLVFDRPLIYADAEIDTSCYDAAWSEKPLWITETLPRIGYPLKKEDFPDMKAVIDRAMKDAPMSEGRKRARDEAWQHSGESARLIFEYVVNKQKSYE